MVKKSLSEIATEANVSVAPEEKESLYEASEPGKMSINTGKIRESTNLFFATPCYGGMLTDQYFLSMFRTSQLLIQHAIKFRLTTLRNESLIPRARNILTSMFLESDCSHLMFIDADIEFPEDAILRMLAMDKEFIAAAYPKKTLPIDYAINLKYVDKERKNVRMEMGAVEVLDASTGFMLIRRSVFDKMVEAYPELHYKNDSSIDPKFNKHCYSLFDTMHDPKDNRYLSEDYTFCRRWQAIGGEIWMDINTKLNHVGAYTFEGDVSKIFNFDQFRVN